MSKIENNAEGEPKTTCLMNRKLNSHVCYTASIIL